jgi:hypothetical protein
MVCAFALSTLFHAFILLADPSFLGNLGVVSGAHTKPGESRLLARLSPSLAIPGIVVIPEETSHSGAVSTTSPVNAMESVPTTGVPRFFDANTLDKRPRAVADQIPGESEFNLIASTGTIRLRLWIDEHGDVVHVTVERGDLPLEFGEQLALAFRAIRFEPGERQGRAVGSILNVEVTYADSRKSSS